MKWSIFKLKYMNEVDKYQIINVHNIYDQTSYHRLLIEYQVNNTVIIVMRWRYIRYWNRRSAYITFTIDISSCRRRVCPRTVVPSSTLSSKFTQCRHRQHIWVSVSYYILLSWYLIYYIVMQRKYLCASWSFLQWAVTPRTQPPLLGPRSYSRPVDGVSAGHAGGGYASRLSWQ